MIPSILSNKWQKPMQKENIIERNRMQVRLRVETWDCKRKFREKMEERFA